MYTYALFLTSRCRIGSAKCEVMYGCSSSIVGVATTGFALTYELFQQQMASCIDVTCALLVSGLGPPAIAACRHLGDTLNISENSKVTQSVTLYAVIQMSHDTSQISGVTLLVLHGSVLYNTYISI